MRYKKFVLVAGMALAIFCFPSQGKTATFANVQSSDTGWRCFASTQDATTFEITWGIPMGAFTTSPESVTSQTLKIATWTYSTAQGFYLSVSSTPSSIEFPPSSGWIQSTNTVTSRTDGIQSTLTGYSDAISDTYTGTPQTFLFPSNTVGVGHSSGTLWLKLTGNHPSNTGDRACIRSGALSGAVLTDYEYPAGVAEIPVGTLTYENNTAGLLPLNWGLPSFASSTEELFASSTTMTWCDGLYSSSTIASSVATGISAGLCRLVMVMFVPSENSLKTITNKSNELLTQFPFSIIGQFASAVSSTTANTSASSTTLSFDFSQLVSTTTSMGSFMPSSVEFLGRTTYEKWTTTTTRTLLRGTVSLSIWWGLLYSTYLLALSFLKKKHE